MTRENTSEIETLIGDLPKELQARLTARLGGQQIEIPKHFRGRAFDLLAETVGDFGAERLCRMLGAGRFYVPRLWGWQIEARNEEVRTLYGFGLSAQELSRLFGVSTRTIQFWTKT
jgi:hypothetical protein